MRTFGNYSRERALLVGLCAVLIGAALAGCGGSGGMNENEIAVVGYSIVGPVYEKVLEPAFQKTKQGEGVTFTNSFGPSTDQSRAVVAGQPASVVNFSQPGDMERLVREGEIVSRFWAGEVTTGEGMGQNSAVAMIVRKGNPKGLKTLRDLLTENVRIITPNPFSSGTGRWNLMAVYGSVLGESNSPAQALKAVKTVLAKAVVQPRSALDATAAFLHGKGDVLLTSESEGIHAKEEGKADYIVPPTTLLTEAPIAFTKDAPPAAKAFVEFIWSEAGQELLADNGYRPIYTEMVGSRFPTPVNLFAIKQFSDWPTINREFFNEQNGSITKIEQELGVPTSG